MYITNIWLAEQQDCTCITNIWLAKQQDCTCITNILLTKQEEFTCITNVWLIKITRFHEHHKRLIIKTRRLHIRWKCCIIWPRPQVSVFVWNRRFFGYRKRYVFKNVLQREDFWKRWPLVYVWTDKNGSFRMRWCHRSFTTNITFLFFNVFYGRAKTIRIRYLWTRIFFKTEQKDLRFQKYPDTCGRVLCCGASTLICFKLTFQIYRAFSLTWSASMLIYWNKRKFLHKKRVQLPQDCWNTNMAAVSLFWNTNIAAVTSCENARLQRKNSLVWDTNTRQIRKGKESGLS